MRKSRLNKISLSSILEAEQLELFSDYKGETFYQKVKRKLDIPTFPYLPIERLKRTEKLFNEYTKIPNEEFIERIKNGKKYGIRSSATLAEHLELNEFALSLITALDRNNVKVSTRYKKLKWIINNEDVNDFINSLSNEELIYAGRIFLAEKKEEIVSLISKKLYEKGDIYEAIAFSAYKGDYQKAASYLSENWEYGFEGDKLIIIAHFLRKKGFPSSLFYKKVLEYYEKHGSKRSVRYAKRFFKKMSKAEEKTS